MSKNRHIHYIITACLAFLITVAGQDLSGAYASSVSGISDLQTKHSSLSPIQVRESSTEEIPGLENEALPDDEPIPLDPPQERKQLDREKQRKADEDAARALEEAQRQQSEAQLPNLSQDRTERLVTLFETLKKTKNNALAEKAEQEIQRTWAQSGSDTIDLFMSWANAAMEKRHFGKALDYLDNVIRLKPDFAEGWNRRATLYFLQKNYGRSIADVERTLELEPRHFGALAGLGSMLRELGQEKEALFAFEKALDVNPTMTRIRDAAEALRKKVEGREI